MLQPGSQTCEYIWKKGQKPNRNYIEVTRFQWGIDGWILVFRDITKVRNLERVRRDFFANVSHELKTPMAIIQAHAEALSEGAFYDEVMGPKFVDALLRNS